MPKFSSSFYIKNWPPTEQEKIFSNTDDVFSWAIFFESGGFLRVLTTSNNKTAVSFTQPLTVKKNSYITLDVIVESNNIKVCVNNTELSLNDNAPFNEPVPVEAQEAQLIETIQVTLTVSETQTNEEKAFVSMLYRLVNLQNNYSPESSKEIALILCEYLFNYKGLINHISKLHSTPVSYLASEVNNITSDADIFVILPYVPGGIRQIVKLLHDDFVNLIVVRSHDKITGLNTTLSIKEIIFFFADKTSDLKESKIDLILKLRDNVFTGTRSNLHVLLASITSSVIDSILPLVTLVSQS